MVKQFNSLKKSWKISFCQKKCYSLSFPLLGGRDLTRALQSTPFQNPGRVPWAWHTDGGRTDERKSSCLILDGEVTICSLFRRRAGRRPAGSLWRTKTTWWCWTPCWRPTGAWRSGGLSPPVWSAPVWSPPCSSPSPQHPDPIEWINLIFS